MLSSLKPILHQQTNNTFIRTIIVIFIAVLLFFILIILIIIIIIKSKHFHSMSTATSSSEDKVSSSSFAPSLSTALSTDSPANNTHYHQHPQPILSTINYQNYINQSSIFVNGLVPQSNLTPRFHRQQQNLDDKRRIPLHIRSPSLSRINPFIDHASLTTNEQLKKVQLPQVTRLQNGDLIISA